MIKRVLGLPLYPPVWFLLQLAGARALQYAFDQPFALPGHRLLGLTLGSFGLLLIVTAMITVQRHHTPILPYREPRQLLTRGPFRLSRNPIYLGEAIILAALALRSGELLPWLPLPLFIIGLSLGPIRWEENALRHQFGAAFTDYCQRTRRWV